MTTIQWNEAIHRYYKMLQGDYHLGYLAGLLEGSFVIPHDIDPELFLEYLLEKDYDPFVIGFDKCVEAYRNDAAENYECA